MRLRDIIDIVERLNERIVYRSRFKDELGRQTVIAVNPTKEEWDKFFPHGAGGVICTRNRIAIGEGEMLPHDQILNYAKINQSDEKYRLQISRTHAYVELWMFNDDWGDELPTEEQIAEFATQKYGETLEQIDAQLRAMVTPFAGNIEMRVIPLGEDQEPLRPQDVVFIQAAFQHRG